MTALAANERPRRLADRIAARAIVLALDPHATVDRVAETVARLADGDRRVIEQAARRIYFDERPGPVADRALAALEAALARTCADSPDGAGTPFGHAAPLKRS